MHPYLAWLLLLLTVVFPMRSPAQADPSAPTDPKAQKTFVEAQQLERAHRFSFALDSYSKADKQDGNRCVVCSEKVVELGIGLGDYKPADLATQELIAEATTPSAQARAHLKRAQLLVAMGKAKKRSECFHEAEQESDTALTLEPGNNPALYMKGECLADQQQDEAARQVFTELLPRLKSGSIDAGRVARYVDRPELVRARMAPAFTVTTLDGQRVSLDELRNKVVLIDFWATWCGPCREALPHMQRIARQFAGQPLVVLSISLDSDESKWKDFVGRNGMTWLQYRDGGFTGPLSRTFGVEAIPHTFTIDSDGVLQDEHVGDASIEGKLKKLIEQARKREDSAETKQVASSAP